MCSSDLGEADDPNEADDPDEGVGEADDLTWPCLVSTFAYIYRNILRPTLGVNQKDSYKERIPKNTLMRIPIRKRTLHQEREVNHLLV